MKTVLPKIDKRITNQPAKAHGILMYDRDNLYPQRMRDYVNASGTTTSCVNIYGKFIRGKGFEDKNFYKTIIDKEGCTVDQLLRHVSQDKALYNGFAIHVMYNLFGNIVSATPINFEYCRLGDQAKIGKIAVYDDWDRQIRPKIEYGQIEWYDRFDLNKNAVLNQIEAAGGIENYKGQILWKTPNKKYPMAPYDSIIEDVIVDAGVKIFRLKGVTSSFLASVMVEYPYEPESDDEKLEVKGTWEEFQGVDRAGKAIIVFNPNMDKASVTVKTLDLQNNDKMFELTNKTCKQSIRGSFSQPPSLFGENEGAVFSSVQIKDGYDFYNSFTEDERIMIEEVFRTIFSAWETQINVSGNYSIIPLSFGTSTVNNG